MEPTRYYIFTTTDKAERDAKFEQKRNSTEANERQAVKFSGAQEKEGTPGFYETTYTVAWPFEIADEDFAKKYAPKHGSKRSPRTFPGRKQAV